MGSGRDDAGAEHGLEMGRLILPGDDLGLNADETGRLEEPVEFGATLAREHGFANLEYRLGDIEDPPITPGSVDLALFSQALHHANNPARALAAAYRLLKPGGRVAVLDLLAHQFEQARELYADTWLGFSEAELHRMLEAAGFAGIEVQVVAREDEPPHFQTMFGTGIVPAKP